MVYNFFKQFYRLPLLHKIWGCRDGDQFRLRKISPKNCHFLFPGDMVHFRTKEIQINIDYHLHFRQKNIVPRNAPLVPRPPNGGRGATNDSEEGVKRGAVSVSERGELYQQDEPEKKSIQKNKITNWWI